MRRFLRVLARSMLALLLTLGLLVVAATLALTTNRDGVVDASVGLLSSSSSGGSVRVEGDGVRTVPFGEADPVTGAPSSGDERFRIGSVTKTFVATVILQLVDEDQVALDTPIERYLPGSVPGGAAITVRQVLNHTSGLHDYMKKPELSTNRWRGDQRFTSYDPEELLRVAATLPPYFTPGTDFRYSNTNYIVAGLIIEAVTGNDYADEVQRRILDALELADTTLPGTDPTIGGDALRAQAELPDGASVDVTDQDESLDWAAGEMISTTHDLDRFFDALLTSRLTSADSLRQMQTTVPMGMGFHYGLGLERLDLPCGGQLWGHGGKLLGYLTYAYRREDGRSLMLVAASTEGDEFIAFSAVAWATYCP